MTVELDDPIPKFAEYKQLDGSSRRQLKMMGSGSIIKRFEKTGLPNGPTDVVCPHFVELKWAYGCPYDCAWCYLQGTLRFTGKVPRFKDRQIIAAHVRDFLRSDSDSELLNTGELADSLMGEGQAPFSRFIYSLMSRQNKHKVLFLTKGVKVDHLLDLKASNLFVLSWSLNAERVADIWEHRAPKVNDRIEAAGKCFDAGYEVRLRIDPIIPGFSEDYLSLIDRIFDRLKPARLTLGSLRGLYSTIAQAKDRTWVKYLAEKSSWGKRTTLELRVNEYRRIIDAVRSKSDHTVALCKETIECWERLGMNYKTIKCNCIS